eukprot:TRINITY_DN1706_c0_g1_i7.p12 TRINITY_DN1706_c0_g1~~TRINITY_DN1706_c0_g1_i7.p12  ORF type:complete len:119 (+),score=1.52 TRINITY_DN1706_c0_g1_i7:3690-4046(+)
MYFILLDLQQQTMKNLFQILLGKNKFNSNKIISQILSTFQKIGMQQHNIQNDFVATFVMFQRNTCYLKKIFKQLHIKPTKKLKFDVQNELFNDLFSHICIVCLHVYMEEKRFFQLTIK